MLHAVRNKNQNMYRFILNETSSFTHKQKLRRLSQKSCIGFVFTAAQANKSSFMFFFLLLSLGS
jgi:hypothetical protein